ncbi:MAG: hypothetical protein DI571_02995 [Arsenicicoccus sp.]|nr:MAG: hypothetical protein DI571_02995 [Arsenicicoccus sp.]
MDVTVTTTFDAPRPLVAAIAGDPDQAMRWYANIRSVRWRSAPEVAEGARVDFVARFLGRQLAYTYEIVDLVPDERLVMRTDDGPFPMETTYTWWDEDPAQEGGPARTAGHAPRPGAPAAGAARGAGRAPRRRTDHGLARPSSANFPMKPVLSRGHSRGAGGAGRGGGFERARYAVGAGGEGRAQAGRSAVSRRRRGPR